MDTILGVILGFFLKILYDNRKKKNESRLKIMDCFFYENRDIGPFTSKSKRNMYLKKFRLVNSTKMHIDKFTVVFFFENAVIKSMKNHCKAGDDKYRFETSNPSEVTCTIENFNVNGEIDFEFKVEELNKEHKHAVNEHNAKGFIINVIDQMRPILIEPIPSKQVNRITFLTIPQK